MITPASSDFAHSLSKYYFGNEVALVVKCLFNYDQASLRVVKSHLPQTKLSEIKKALLVLVKYQLVDYVQSVKNFNQQYEYSVVPQRIFSFFRIPRFIHSFGSREGKHVEMILATIAERALIDRNKLSQLLFHKIKENESLKSDELLGETTGLLESLITRKFVVQAGNNICLGIERLNRDYRDGLIVDTIGNFYPQVNKIKDIAKAILEISFENTLEKGNTTSPVPFQELSQALVPKTFQDEAQLKKCLGMLVTESNNRFITSSGNHPVKGAMYAVNVGSVIHYLVKEYISSIITSRFGPRCCRVFKVLIHKGPLLLRQIEELIMLPARDVREYSYMLIKEGFITNRQVPKTTDHAPSKSVFIMYVQLDRIVYETADLCCRSINNLMIRYEHEMSKNQPLLDRSKAVKELIAASDEPLDEASIRETWGQYFNSHELAQLERIDFILNKILLARTQLDETLFLLHVWLELRPDQVEDPCY